MMKKICIYCLFAFVLIYVCSRVAHDQRDKMIKPFPGGYIDSPFVVPDGSAIYFIYSVAATKDMLTGNPEAKPVAAYLEGHHAQDGDYWWNTDIYVSRSNPDGTWGRPRNLGSNVNSQHLESGPWVNAEETVLIFTRESVTDPSLSGSFITNRATKTDPWGVPQKLPGILGDYGRTNYQDFHECPSGDLYFWSEASGDGVLYFSRCIGKNEWSKPVRLPDEFQSDQDETQPWVNDAETIIYFNRRGEDSNTSLMRATRSKTSEAWSAPQVVTTKFSDAAGNAVWGEPSFIRNGAEMYFVMFDTSTRDWHARLMMASKNAEGGYGSPKPLVFKFK